MIIRALGPQDWRAYAQIRLRALADSPEAFGSTLAREQLFTETDWRARLGSPVLLAEEDGLGVALAGLYRNNDDRNNDDRDSDERDGDASARLWGVWTEPSARGRGHASALLDALFAGDPAVADGAPVELEVNLANTAARRLYERHGFLATGERRPLRPDSDQLVERMVRGPVVVAPAPS